MANDQEDEAAIVELLHANRIAMWTADFDAWRECFVHADYTTRWGWWRAGGVFVRRGWREIEGRVGRDFPRVRHDYAYDTKIRNLTIRIVGDVAWAVFEQLYPGYDMLPGHVGPSLIHEMRILERHDGRWKIAFLGFLDGNAGEPGARIIQLAPDATVLWVNPAASEVLPDHDDLVIRNNRLRFRQTSIDARFRSALDWAAHLDDGLMSRRGSMPLVVEAGQGLPVNVYWVSVEAGTLFLSFGPLGSAERRLGLAARIFGLSEAQTRLATHIAEGLTLPDAAAAMGVTLNTARTHLQRIYEKTGVHHQTALVRVLLSVGAAG
ncbi:helix-turn-helix domain-containing protein [Devosia nitrariae]|uniref:HTH luxR-type domain-containing protein n=1 Tax=Devosia nitrariae TaxID=2071872 RepID=A0ABQ5WBT3_9HYPH|nr:helix-turn-helix transcriptional regulator [Devosia nitrariae]GLQ57209.1 hypothetical protein GCM10010862_44680 [Devosia nitrariae]